MLCASDFADQLRPDTYLSVERDARASEQGAKQIPLVRADSGHEPARLNRAAAASGDEEGQIFSRMLVAILEA